MKRSITACAKTSFLVIRRVAGCPTSVVIIDYRFDTFQHFMLISFSRGGILNATINFRSENNIYRVEM